MANSLGSLLTSWLALDHPDRVAALVHIGCPAIVFDTTVGPSRLPTQLWGIARMVRGASVSYI